MQSALTGRRRDTDKTAPGDATPLTTKSTERNEPETGQQLQIRLVHEKRITAILQQRLVHA
jgi:hypothetical protein